MERSQASEPFQKLDEAEVSSFVDESDSEIGISEPKPRPEWAKLKEATKAAKNAKSRQTRDRNFLMRAQRGVAEIKRRMAEIPAPAAPAEESRRPRTKKRKGSYDIMEKTKRGRKRPRRVDTSPHPRRSSTLLRQKKSKV
jgi:hypothetical protein